MTAGPSAAVEPGAVFVAAVVSSVADVASSVACFIGMEVGEGPVSAAVMRSGISVVGVPAVIDVSVEATWPMEPGSGAEEDTANKPVGAVVAIGSAVLRGIVEVAVG